MIKIVGEKYYYYLKTHHVTMDFIQICTLAFKIPDFIF